MKTIAIILGMTLTGIVAEAQNSKPLEVVVENVVSNQGVMMVALYNTKKGFTSDPWRGEKPVASKGTMHVFFKDVPPGEYAIAVYHDENQNQKLDSNLIGMPKEGYGFSKDAMGSFGPPSFEKALIRWSGTESYTIHLKYP